MFEMPILKICYHDGHAEVYAGTEGLKGLVSYKVLEKLLDPKTLTEGHYEAHLIRRGFKPKMALKRVKI